MNGAPSHAAARANVNVALVKYWGKRDARLNLPAVGSISLTLDGLYTEARVALGEGRDDEVMIDGQPAVDDEAQRVHEFLERVRAEAHARGGARVEMRSNVPRGVGLASSAAAFAALSVAASHAAGLTLDPARLSRLARLGSGSAARSIFGGFVEWHRGERADGSDSLAEPLAPLDHWDLHMVIAVTDETRKAVSSRVGMERAASSPLYPAWVAGQEADLAEARAAIHARDLDALGPLAEHSALKMHAVGMAARPPLLYWRSATVEVMQRVWALRAEGLAAYFTVDAGPQVKVLCAATDVQLVAAALRDLPGVCRVLIAGPGAGAEVVA